MRFEIYDAELSAVKGLREPTLYTFDSNKVDVIGRNGSGKTTLGIACVYPFTKKDLTGKSNPELHPDFMSESEPHITLNCHLDGNPVTVELVQKDIRTKKDRQQDRPPKISNTYIVNGVEKSETAFKADMLERGLDISLYEKLSSPDYFMNLKENDKRKTVFELVSEISDIDVADSLGEVVAETRKQLDSYKLEEIDALAKQNKKKSDAQCTSLPEQIKGLEAAIVGIDVKSLTQQKSELSLKLSDITNQITGLSDSTKSSINARITELSVKQRVLESEINAEREKNIRDRRIAVEDAQREYKFSVSKTASIEESLERMNSIFRNSVFEFDKLSKEYNELEQKTFPEDRLVCESCGQILPPIMLEENKRNWQKNKDENLLALKKRLEICNDQVKEAKAKMDSVGSELDECRQHEKDLSRKYEVLKNELEFAEAAPTGSVWDNEEYKSLDVEIETLKASLDNANDAEQKRADLIGQSIEIKEQIHAIDMELAKEEINAHTRSEIEKLRENLKQAAQNQADAEKIIYQVSLINKRKNEMLSDSINSKFADFIKFKLFFTQKNGEDKDCCVPLVRNEAGEWKELGKTANTALEMQAKLAILDGFQKFYDMHIPIIVDNASELDTESKKRINLDTQIIFLSVADCDITFKSLS